MSGNQSQLLRDLQKFLKGNCQSLRLEVESVFCIPRPSSKAPKNIANCVGCAVNTLPGTIKVVGKIIFHDFCLAKVGHGFPGL